MAEEEKKLGHSNEVNANFQKSYELSIEYLGEADPLSQKIKFHFKQFKDQIMKQRNTDMEQVRLYSHTKFVVKDRRIAAEARNQWKHDSSIRTPPQRESDKKVRQIKQVYLRAHSQKLLSHHSPTITHQLTGPHAQSIKQSFTVQVTPKHQIKRTKKLKSKKQYSEAPKTGLYFYNSDSFNSDAPSRAVISVKKSEHEPILFHTPETFNVLSWSEDINKDLEIVQPTQAKLTLMDKVIIKEQWEQDDQDSVEMQDDQKRNRQIFLNSMNNITAHPKKKYQNLLESKISNSSKKDNAPEAIKSKQLESNDQPLNVQTKSIEFSKINNQTDGQSVLESSKQNDRKSVQSIEPNKQDLEQQNPFHLIRQNNFDQLINSSERQELPQSKQLAKASIVANSQIPSIPATIKRTKQKRIPTIEQSLDYNSQMLKRMETHLLSVNIDYQKSYNSMTDSSDKEQTMVLMNQKKQDQINQAQQQLDALKKSYDQQKQKLEEMHSHQLRQLNAIEVLHQDKLQCQEVCDEQLQRFHAANIIKRYLILCRDRVAWDNYKLHREKNIIIFQKFITTKLTQKLDPVHIQTQYRSQRDSLTHNDDNSQKRLKIKQSGIVFGTLAIYIDTIAHQLIFKFYAPSESIEIRCNRVAFYHREDTHLLEQQFGKIDSQITRSKIYELLSQILSQQIIVDYKKERLVVDSQNHAARGSMVIKT